MTTPNPIKPKPVGKGASLEDFRKEYDVDMQRRKAIEAGLKSLGASWETETDFSRRCGIGLSVLAKLRDEYEHYWVRGKKGNNKKVLWAGTKEFAAQMRECTGE